MHLQDATLSEAATHLSLTSTLSSLPDSDEPNHILHHHQQLPVHHHDLHRHVIDHQLQELQEQQEQEELQKGSQVENNQISQNSEKQQQEHTEQRDSDRISEGNDVDFAAFASSLLIAPDEKLDLTQTFPSKDALLLHLNRYATVSGFRLSRTSSRPEHIRIQCWKRSKTSKYTRKDDDSRKRRASYGTTRSTDCPFFLNCWHHKKSGCWYVKSSNILHNHDFSQDLISQKSLSNDERNLLKDLSYAGAELSRNIPVTIINAKRRERGIPDVDPKLVSNALAKCRQARDESLKAKDMGQDHERRNDSNDNDDQPPAK